MTDPKPRPQLQEQTPILGNGVDRRQALAFMVGAAAVPLLGCGEGVPGESDTSSETGDRQCPAIPPETAGPYPGNGTNGANALILAGIHRVDMRTSIAGATKTAAGSQLNVTLTLVDSNDGCTPLVNYAVYLWHCDQVGDYSMYTGAAAGENYLRGLQAANEAGEVSFITTFPGCYPGRWPHLHFEIYETLEAAMSGAPSLFTSQLALTKEACEQAYDESGYEASKQSLAEVSLGSDGSFGDGAMLQRMTVTKMPTHYEATLQIGIPIG
ncbi:MAG: dioxygenase [Nannocystaceae bacterium]